MTAVFALGAVHASAQLRHHVLDCVHGHDGEVLVRETERDRWNRRYQTGDVNNDTAPSAFLVECLPEVMRLTRGRQALDVACGQGRNCLFLAQSGFGVLGVDVSDVGLDAARRLLSSAGACAEFARMDLREETPQGPFDLIVCFNFLLRPLIPRLGSQLAPGGCLVIESMMQETGPNGPLHSPEFVVAEGELPVIVESAGLRVLRSGEELSRAKSRVFATKG